MLDKNNIEEVRAALKNVVSTQIKVKQLSLEEYLAKQDFHYDTTEPITQTV